MRHFLPADSSSDKADIWRCFDVKKLDYSNCSHLLLTLQIQVFWHWDFVQKTSSYFSQNIFIAIQDWLSEICLESTTAPIITAECLWWAECQAIKSSSSTGTMTILDTWKYDQTVNWAGNFAWSAKWCDAWAVEEECPLSSVEGVGFDVWGSKPEAGVNAGGTLECCWSKWRLWQGKQESGSWLTLWRGSRAEESATIGPTCSNNTHTTTQTGLHRPPAPSQLS
jgi:hypothetical protein